MKSVSEFVEIFLARTSIVYTDEHTESVESWRVFSGGDTDTLPNDLKFQKA